MRDLLTNDWSTGSRSKPTNYFDIEQLVTAIIIEVYDDFNLNERGRRGRREVEDDDEKSVKWSHLSRPEIFYVRKKDWDVTLHLCLQKLQNYKLSLHSDMASRNFSIFYGSHSIPTTTMSNCHKLRHSRSSYSSSSMKCETCWEYFHFVMSSQPTRSSYCWVDDERNQRHEWKRWWVTCKYINRLIVQDNLRLI